MNKGVIIILKPVIVPEAGCCHPEAKPKDLPASQGKDPSLRSG
jgi:hypothetical protein